MPYLRINHAAVQLWKDILPNPANICLFKVNNRNIRKRPEIGSKLTIKTPERLYWARSGYKTANFELFHTFSWFSYCWLGTGKYLLGKLSDIWYPFDICFNMSTGGGQDLIRSNAGNSVIFPLFHTLSKI